MTTLLPAAFLLSTGALACLAIVLHNYGLIGCAYLLSAFWRSVGDGILTYRIAWQEYRRQAMEAAPRRVIEVRPARPLKGSTLGRLARIVGKAARRPAWRDARELEMNS